MLWCGVAREWSAGGRGQEAGCIGIQVGGGAPRYANRTMLFHSRLQHSAKYMEMPGFLLSNYGGSLHLGPLPSYYPDLPSLTPSLPFPPLGFPLFPSPWSSPFTPLLPFPYLVLPSLPLPLISLSLPSFLPSFLPSVAFSHSSPPSPLPFFSM